MRFDPPLVDAILLKRYKRFLADVEFPDGTVVVAHCPNPGSMKSCAEPGWGARVSPATNPKRKLKWTLEIVDAAGTQILVNTARPNHIVKEAIENGHIAELDGYSRIRTEVKYGENSRIDLLLEKDDTADCFVEIKNVTLLAEPGVAAFPDSVSKRATKHMEELTSMVQQGHRAVVFFLVSRTDVNAMRPADEFDPKYGEALRAAVAAGVEAIAYRLDFGPGQVTVGERLPIVL